jgi:pimeloyl-ACP methyl ester carboxylesterase
VLELVDVGGLRVAVRRRGLGEPVLLIHGGMSDSREWGPQVQDLSPDYDVIAVDVLGCGGSADPPEDFGLVDHAHVLQGTLDALGVSSAHVIGVSLGSVLALSLYREHPGAVRSLVLAGAYAGWAGSLPAEEVESRKRMVLETLERPVEEWGPFFLATVHGVNAPAALVEASMAMLRDVRPEASRRLVLAIASADLREMLPSITVPVLLIYGQDDQRAPGAVAKRLHAGIPGAELVVLPGAGHAVNVEAPEEFDAAVRAFLRRSAAADLPDATPSEKEPR